MNTWRVGTRYGYLYEVKFKDTGDQEIIEMIFAESFDDVLAWAHKRPAYRVAGITPISKRVECTEDRYHL